MSTANPRCRLPILIALAATLAGLTNAQAPSQPAVLPSPQVAANPPASLVAQPAPTAEETGDALAAHQRYQAAIEAYKKAPQNDAQVLNKMGIAYQMMFDLTDASRCYVASLHINSHNSSVLNNLGTTYDALKQYGDAERMYRRALKVDPKSAVILKNLGTSQLAEHKYRQGWQSYQAALAIDPHIFDGSSGPIVENPASATDRGAMNYYMAKSCVRAGMNDRAIEYLRLALNEGFTNPKKINADHEFAGLHGLPAFERLLAAQTAQQPPPQ